MISKTVQYSCTFCGVTFYDKKFSELHSCFSKESTITSKTGSKADGIGLCYCVIPPSPHAPHSVDKTVSSTGGRKDEKPIQLHAIPWEALQELGKAYAYGKGIYGDYNFRKGYKWSLSFDAMQRHQWAFWHREDRDEESGLYHMAHAVWHGLNLLFYSITKEGEDDRPQ